MVEKRQNTTYPEGIRASFLLENVADVLDLIGQACIIEQRCGRFITPVSFQNPTTTAQEMERTPNHTNYKVLNEWERYVENALLIKTW